MMEMESMAVEMPDVAGHPNRAAFRGVLAMVDTPSQRPPSGAKGHRVVLMKRAAEEALPSLLGMALDYAPAFDRHDVRRKVGVITSADIVGRELQVSGYLYARDFPEIVEEIGRFGSGAAGGSRLQVQSEAADSGSPSGIRAWAAVWKRKARKPITLKARADASDTTRSIACAGKQLGMSYEVTDVLLADSRAHVWLLTKVTFTGAAVLRRDKAAYADTWIALE
jgi:hypothetical protein